MSSSLTPVAPNVCNKRHHSLVQKKKNKSEEISDRMLVHILSFLPIKELGRSACVSEKWKRASGWDNNRLWSLVKLDSPKLLTLDESWWRTNVDCEKLKLDPSGCPVMRKATLKATVQFLHRVYPLLDKLEHVIDFTLPKGLSYEHCETLSKLAFQRVKDGKLSAPLSPEMLWCMLTASLDVNCALDHTRLNFRKEGRGLDRTVRLFITSQSFTLTEKNTSSLIPRNAKVRPLPYDYDLNDVTDLWNAVQSGYDWHLSDPYLCFAVGTPQTHRVDFFTRPNFPEWLSLRITPDASTDYKEEKPYSAK